MPGLSLALLQLAAAQPAAPPPDIDLNARVRAREVAIRQQGEASLTLRAEPGVTPPVRVERSAPPGAQHYRNLTLTVHAEARIAEPHLQKGNTADESTPP